MTEAKRGIFCLFEESICGRFGRVTLLNLQGMEEQLVSMMNQLTKAFFPWLYVKQWKISYCNSNFPRNWSMH